MIRALARRWANTHLADENRRLRHDNAYLERDGRAKRHALTTAEHLLAVYSARIQELLHERSKP